MAKYPYDMVQLGDPDAVLEEVLATLADIDPGFDAERLRTVHGDVLRLFRGEYPGYRASDTRYHDLGHTLAVFLCVAAMLHGAHHDGVRISSRGRLLVLICALFHDVGLIRRQEESEGTGARFTVGHEQRSIAFVTRYFAENGLPREDGVDAGHIILCTALNSGIDDIPFRSVEVRTLGRILGSADVVAQMADRAYLEKLLLLFREFREARIPGYASELDLLEKTPGFYRGVVRRRLDEDFDQADSYLKTHARVRWGMNGDPFREAIERNLAYLQRILNTDKTRYRERLRRRRVGGPPRRLTD